MPHNLSRILTAGFRGVGRWSLINGQLEFELSAEAREEKNVLYAFVTNGSLAYVGKTTQALRDRLQRYKTPAKDAKKGGSTNIKNNKNIRAKLLDGHAVEIYLLLNRQIESYGGFQFNFAAGLEDSLIDELRPPWNGRSRKAVETEGIDIVEVSEPAMHKPRQKNLRVARLTVADFDTALSRRFAEAIAVGATHLDVKSGPLHREVGGYPEKGHSMPVCCSVMRKMMGDNDVVLAEPPKGKGATLLIRYVLPR